MNQVFELAGSIRFDPFSPDNVKYDRIIKRDDRTSNEILAPEENLIPPPETPIEAFIARLEGFMDNDKVLKFYKMYFENTEELDEEDGSLYEIWKKAKEERDAELMIDPNAILIPRSDCDGLDLPLFENNVDRDDRRAYGIEVLEEVIFDNDGRLFFPISKK